MVKEKVKELVSEFGGSETNTGSTEVQIAILSKEIANLTEHLKIHKQDKHSRRGLSLRLGKRKRLLNYLEEKDLEKFRSLKKSLGIR